jgi:hypothetical protein
MSIKSLMTGWLEHHRNNPNRVLHAPGIPLAITGLFQLFIARWRAGLLCLFPGYTCRLIGHLCFERSEAGKWLLIKKAGAAFRGSG